MPHDSASPSSGSDSGKSVVIITRRLPDNIETRMRELFDTQLNIDDTPMDRAALIAALQNADILVPTVTDRLDRALFEAAKPLRTTLIAGYGAGVDYIDLAAATEHKITVTNTPGVLTEDTADMTMALILAVPRRLLEGALLMHNPKGVWPGWSPCWMLGRRIGGKRLGIIGMGRIGQAVARRARAFGLQIHYHNRRRLAVEQENEFEATWWDSLDQMLARMDIVSVNCPHTPATYHLLSERRLRLMRPEAYIVNTARGEIVDERALTKLIEKGDIAGAGLDVFEHAPMISPKLRNNNRVVLLPHMGSATLEGRIAMGERVMINIRAFIDGHTPPDRVISSML